MSRKALFAVMNIILLGTFILAVYVDQNREWEKYQSGSKDKGIKQLIVKPLNRVDRCTTCHSKPHSGDIIKKHPPEKFGCTVCHEGQGLGTTVKAAHGDVKHWDKPMLKSALIQASCAKCHEDKSFKGMEVLAKGEELFKDLGCIGCHAIDGWGGNISVDIGEIADKPVEELDFAHVEGERSVVNWMFEHFKNPQKVVPARPDLGVMYPSPMPNYNLTDEDAEALTAFMLSYNAERKSIPRSFHAKAKGLSPEGTVPVKEELGKEAYYKFGCVGCHGKDGVAGIPNFNAQGGKVPTINKVGEGYTASELKKKIRLGVQPVDKENPSGPVPPLWMQKWGERITDEELDNLVAYLMSLMPQEEKWE